MALEQLAGEPIVRSSTFRLDQRVALSELGDHRLDQRVRVDLAAQLRRGAARGSRVPLEVKGCVDRVEDAGEQVLSRCHDDAADVRAAADHALPDSGELALAAEALTL